MLPRPESSFDYSEHVFENVTNSSQIDPSLVLGILRCVPGSGMNTTDEDTLNHIRGDIVVVDVDNQTNEVFAFSSTAFGSPNEIFKTSDLSDLPGCYLAGATVLKEWQGRGFYKTMNAGRIQHALDRHLPLIYSRTQNPRVQAGIQAALEEYQRQGVISSFSLQRVLVSDCYGHMLTDERPTSDSAR